MIVTILRMFFSSYLPAILARPVLRFLHSLLPLSLPCPLPPALAVLVSPPPRPGTPAYVKHFRAVFMTLSLVLIIPSIIPSSEGGPSYYTVLGVRPGADEGALRGAFRSWARKWHPDRAGPRGNVEAAENVFRKGREGYEVLKDPTLRFAYDRFGPDVLDWRECVTPREYLRRGLLQASGYHGVAFAGMLLVTLLGNRSPIVFWRFLLFFALLALELHLILSPSPSSAPVQSSPLPMFISDFLSAPTLMHALFPASASFEHIRTLHRAFVGGTLVLARLFPAESKKLVEQGVPWDVRSVVERVNAISKTVDEEVAHILDTILCSLRTPETTVSLRSLQSSMKNAAAAASTPEQTEKEACVMDALTHEMQNMIIERKLRQESQSGPLRSAWESAVRRAAAPGLSPVKKKNFWERESEEAGSTLPSPVSPSGTPPPLSLPSSPEKPVAGAMARLPSPRPSPPPTMHRRGSSF